jgi:hypothetical protein
MILGMFVKYFPSRNGTFSHPGPKRKSCSCKLRSVADLGDDGRLAALAKIGANNYWLSITIVYNNINS